MANRVLVAPTGESATEAAKFRFEYQVIGAARGNFEWEPIFGGNNDALMANFYATIRSTIRARHGIIVTDAEIITLGHPHTTI